MSIDKNGRHMPGKKYKAVPKCLQIFKNINDACEAMEVECLLIIVGSDAFDAVKKENPHLIVKYAVERLLSPNIIVVDTDTSQPETSVFFSSCEDRFRIQVNQDDTTNKIISKIRSSLGREIHAQLSGHWGTKK